MLMFALTLVAACTIIMVGFHYLILEKIKEINSFYSCWIVSKSIEKLKVRINLTHKKMILGAESREVDLKWAPFVLSVMAWKV